MKQCWGEGDLRAYVDRELSPAQAEAVESHLAECATCAAAHGAIAARAARVTAWMEDLSAEIPAAADIPSSRWNRPAVWAGVAALAAALLLTVALSKQSVPPVAQANLEPPRAQITRGSAPVAAAPVVPRPIRRVPVRSVRRRPAPQEYMALDDEPIDTGFVMRMAMPSGALADVIVDGEGRARAIRPISTNFKENHR